MDQLPPEPSGEEQALGLPGGISELPPEPSGEEQALGLPGGISEGMPVVDAADQVVGTVQLIYYGGASPEAVERALRLQGAEAGSGFGDEVSPGLAGRLLRYGYLRIEGPGISGLQSYVTPEQIAAVVGGQVQLKAAHAETGTAGA